MNLVRQIIQNTRGCSCLAGQQQVLQRMWNNFPGEFKTSIFAAIYVSSKIAFAVIIPYIYKYSSFCYFSVQARDGI